MRGLSGIGRHLGMREVPPPGRTGGCRGSASVSGRRPGRGGRGAGPAGRLAREGAGRGVTPSVPCRLAARNMVGRDHPARSRIVPRAAARSFLALRATSCGVQPHRIAGAARRPCRRPADSSTGAPSRGAGKAAASSRVALPIRRAGVVSTGGAGTDDAGNATSCAVDVRVSRDNGRLTGLTNAASEGRNLPSRRRARQEVDPTPESCPTGTPGVSPVRENGFLTRPFKHLQPPVIEPGEPQVRAIFTYLT